MGLSPFGRPPATVKSEDKSGVERGQEAVGTAALSGLGSRRGRSLPSGDSRLVGASRAARQEAGQKGR
ncbi:hypothetical protein C7B64_13450 [Merismopedia glauca CCAP 1448/3]|uniref:Uncharacterized protein n=1 Tax=Merismopedia glauca CCAP 1448/3 TaxID=1296344 RepID=A0A2T1C284_9CYAN|nr:hypothetical protein C7B64_13450 [Merismopedia glauca CCAP 1448/3]